VTSDADAEDLEITLGLSWTLSKTSLGLIKKGFD
jgi:hypothetical protein